MAKSSSATPAKKEKNNPYRPNVWGMIRDIMVHAINKGQLPVTGLILLLGLVVFKMPAEDVSKLMYATIRQFKTLYYLGWTLDGVIIVTWVIVQRKLTRGYRRELDRINNENQELQKKLLDS
ncbi:MAG: hypothetical protein JWR61_3785 [Ferruginibacter sp.]|uniref:hypothetical protein n=1 Tax=Ferruginibacter sp. TaxID=1940288 RepID=UPI00265A18BA|nr:hypothetical protein [Ferruginibacter sp.]MDB5278830.1 hypothetical protein [Ferruginibacter sp.]